MQVRNVPSTGPRYWTAIVAASIFGVNLGDFIARDLHLGHWQAVPALVALFAATLLAERRSRPGSELYYWIAVVLVRTAATNLADLATHDYDLDELWMMLALAPGLVAVVWFSGATAPAPAPPVHRAVEGAMPVANLWYWLALLVAEDLGTVAGDGIPNILDLLKTEELLLFGSVLVAVFVLRSGRWLGRWFLAAPFYWVTIVAIAAAGLSVGDLIAHLGRVWVSTVITGSFLAAVLVFWPMPRPLVAPRLS